MIAFHKINPLEHSLSSTFSDARQNARKHSRTDRFGHRHGTISSQTSLPVLNQKSATARFPEPERPAPLGPDRPAPIARLHCKGARCKPRNRNLCVGHCRATQRHAIIPRWGETGRASHPKRAGSPGQAPSSGHTGAPQHLRGQRRRAQAPNSARRAAGPHPSPRRILLPWHDGRTPAGTHRCPSQPRNLQLSLFQIGDPPLSLKRPEPTVGPKPTGTQG